MKKERMIVWIALFMVITACSTTSDVGVTELKTEGLNTPQGIDRINPRFSWILESEVQNEKQTARQILVATTPSLLKEDKADLWDSDKVVSGQSNLVRYEGGALSSGMEVFWKVRVWNSQDQPSAWSETASFSMGLLNPDDWKASWIGLDRAVGDDQTEIENRTLSARYLRKEFSAEKQVKRAMAYIVGMGTYELYLNGEKVGDHVLSPALSEYPKRSWYVTYEVTDMVTEGVNTAGVILGNGRYFSPRINAPTPTVTYGFPKLLMQVEIEYEDGTGTKLVTDTSWKLTTEGPITENNEYDGETYDARMELTGWCENGYDDSSWMEAEPVDPSSPVISSQMAEPMRITETIKPVSVSSPEEGVFIFDMGQNMVGWTKLEVTADKGTVIKQRFSETLQEDGNLYLANIRGARVTDTYISKGEGTVSWEPRFVFHGFRYVELTGYPGTPDISVLEGKVIHDDLESTGYFECSEPLINQIYKNAIWGIRGNYRSIPTDCPQRDERQGWLGDRAAGSRGESYMFGIRNLYRNWLTDIFDAQKESGSISDVCPAYWPFYSDNVTWAGTPIELVKMLYDQYGDIDIIHESYAPMKLWVDHMVNNYMDRDLMPRDVYGDWCVPPIDPYLIHTKDPLRLTPGEYLGSAFFYNRLRTMEGFADLIGQQEDAARFKGLAEKMKAAINSEFFNPETGQYANNSATSNILALAFELVPPGYEQLVFDNLVEKIEVEHHAHITTGLIGQEFFNRVLTRYGRTDLAYTVNTQRDYPSYGYMIENGATTIWELWNGNTADPAMNSGNHVMLLGDFLIWLYEDLAGIKPGPDVPGFHHVVMRPHLAGGLDHVKAGHRSPNGWIRSEWQLEEGLFDWKVTIPVNSTATLYIPAEEAAEVLLDGKPIGSAEGSLSGGRFIMDLGSGSYQITTKQE
ncbi:MAG: family 78 glycoside hydrolase catalytic domain [Bacteroidota bacterium]